MNEPQVGQTIEFDLKRSGKKSVKCMAMVYGRKTGKKGMSDNAFLIKIISSEPFIVNNLCPPSPL